MLIFSFCLATAALFLQGVDLPGVPLSAYIPWIALAALKLKGFAKPLFGAAGVGVLVDLFSDSPMGLYPISYASTAALLFRFRNRFHYDQPLHLALFASFASLASSLLRLFFLFLFDRRIPVAGQWILVDWITVALIDGIYTIVWFSGPLYLWVKARRYWMLFWLKRNQNRSPA